VHALSSTIDRITAMIEKSRFGRLLKRYLDDHVSGKEKLRLEAWLDLNKTQADKRFTWKKEDQARLFQKITGTIDKADSVGARRHTHRTSFAPGQWVRIAATVLVLLPVTSALWCSFGQMLKTDKEIANCEMKASSGARHSNQNLLPEISSGIGGAACNKLLMKGEKHIRKQK